MKQSDASKSDLITPRPASPRPNNWRFGVLIPLTNEEEAIETFQNPSGENFVLTLAEELPPQ